MIYLTNRPTKMHCQYDVITCRHKRSILSWWWWWWWCSNGCAINFNITYYLNAKQRLVKLKYIINSIQTHLFFKHKKRRNKKKKRGFEGRVSMCLCAIPQRYTVPSIHHSANFIFLFCAHRHFVKLQYFRFRARSFRLSLTTFITLLCNNEMLLIFFFFDDLFNFILSYSHKWN